MADVKPELVWVITRLKGLKVLGEFIEHDA
jgi:hypothetical protein